MYTIAAKLENLAAAEAAIQELLGAHIPADAISVMARVDGEMEEKALEHETAMIPGAAIGGTLGVIIGALGAAVVAGPVASVPVFVAAATSGTLGGAIAGLVWWRETAETYADAFDDDSAVWVAVRHQTMGTRAADILRSLGARVYERGGEVTEAQKDSFPASDPPSSNPGHA